MAATRSAIALAAVLLGMPTACMAVVAVMFEAESGTLGSDFIISNSTGVVYITCTNNNGGFSSDRPQLPSRVTSYNVRFPEAGTYRLYARVRVGPGGVFDDSFLYANGFGVKSVSTAVDWITVSGVDSRGFVNPTDLVTVGGTAASNVWKWINVSQDTGSSGETPITFTVVPGDLSQVFQIGGKEDGFDMDKFVFGLTGTTLTVADLDAVTEAAPPPPLGQILAPAFLTNGNLSLSYGGIPGRQYAAESADILVPPVPWAPLLTNTADSIGLVSFSITPVGSQSFFRIRDATGTDTNPPPLVYAVENTGTNFPAPPLPPMGSLPIIMPLPDPFMWSGIDPYNWTYPSGRSTSFADWTRRRAEIKAEIEYYEIGYKPPVDPAMIFASVSGSGTGRTLTVRVTNIVSGTPRTLTLTSAIGLPASSGTFPAIIGMNSPNGSISLGGRAIATIVFSHNQVTTYGNPANSNPYYALYAPPYAAPAPYAANINIDTTGQYSAWSWGVSRLIDGLHKLNGNLGGGVQINLERIGVTGCSYAGKMALFAGELDERIALTIPQESGGGGAPNWRYSWQEEPLGTVEGLGQTDHNWFSESMFTFAGANTARLPHDHHELMAMVAPRALFATGNPDGAVWLSNPSCYVSCKAVERVYDTFGISDRLGFNINGGKPHCARTTDLDNDVYAFLDKFLLGMTNVDTLSVRHVPAGYGNLDHARWTAWWGTTDPTFGGTATATYTNTYEPECATVGSAWQILSDAQASNGKYVTVTPGVESIDSAPTGATNLIVIPFSIPTNGTVSIFARVNCPSADDDSFWVQVNAWAPTAINQLSNGGTWTWVSFGTFDLAAGAHTLTLGYREDGALLDKILVSDYQFTPSGLGPAAAILCP